MYALCSPVYTCIHVNWTICQLLCGKRNEMHVLLNVTQTGCINGRFIYWHAPSVDHCPTLTCILNVDCPENSLLVEHDPSSTPPDFSKWSLHLFFRRFPRGEPLWLCTCVNMVCLLFTQLASCHSWCLFILAVWSHFELWSNCFSVRVTFLSFNSIRWINIH